MADKHRGRYNTHRVMPAHAGGSASLCPQMSHAQKIAHTPMTRHDRYLAVFGVRAHSLWSWAGAVWMLISGLLVFEPISPSTKHINRIAARLWAGIILFILFAGINQAQAAISLVKNIGTIATKDPHTQLSVTVPAAGVAAGNTVIIAIALDYNSGNTPPTPSCSDSKGNTYTLDVEHNASNAYQGAICSAPVTNALVSGDTITVTHASLNASAMSANEFSGLLTAGALDKTAKSAGSSTAPDSTATATTAQADELLFGTVSSENPPTTTFTAGAGFTALTGAGTTGASGNSNMTVYPEYRIVTSTGAYSATGTLSASSNWIAAIATYKAAATTTLGDGTAPANKNVSANDTNKAVDAFTLSTNTGTDTLTALTVTFSGTSAADVAASGVKLWDDSTGTIPNEWDASDTQIGSGVSFIGTTASFSGLSIGITTTPKQYLVTYNIAAAPGSNDTLLGAVTAAVTTNNPLTISDTTDATLTTPYCQVTIFTDGGAGSLRQCIINANANPGADIINVPAGTYTLTIAGTAEDAAATGDLDITGDLTIIGAGMASTIINGNALDRVFEIRAGTVTIQDIRIQNGAAAGTSGGGINHLGTSLTLNRVVVSGNTANAGAGINNTGTLALTDVELSGNTSVAGGGGMFIGNTTTWTRGTISNNSSGASGGGINVTAAGASATLTNVTISNNTASNSGGALTVSKTLSLINVTIYGNTSTNAANAVIFRSSPGTITFTNTIVANNSTINCNGTAGFTSNGYNLESATNTCNFIVTGDQNSVTAGNLNIGALANNGGPTQTHALLAGSFAIDKIPNGTNGCGTTITTDQRGTARPQNATCDVGAYEYAGAAATTTLGDGAAPASRNVGRSTTNRAVDAFTLSTSSGSDTLTGLTVTLSGTGAAADIAASGVKIWKDNGTAPNEWDAGDTQIGSGVSMSGATATFTGLTEGITTSSVQYLITYDISAAATPGNTLLGRVSAATTTNALTNNDTTDNTLTVAAVSGTVYSDEGATVLAGKSVKLVNAGTGGNSDTTDAFGRYAITATLAAGNAIIAYIDNDTTSKANTVTLAGGTAIAGLDLYAGRVITRCDNVCSLTIANMGTALGAYTDAGDILYSMTGSLTISGAGTAINIPVGHTFAPGAAITVTPAMAVRGTFTAGSFTHTVSGTPFVVTGAFTAGTSTIAFTATSGTILITPGGQSFFNVTFNDAAGTATYQLQGALTATNDLTLTDGILDTRATFNYAINVTRDFTQPGAGGRVLAQSSTVTVGRNITLNGTELSTGWNAASLVLTGTGGLTYSALASAWTNGFYNLTVGQSGNTTTINNQLAVLNLLTVGTGTFTGLPVNGAVYLYKTGTTSLVFDPASTVSVSWLKFFASGTQTLPTLNNGYSSNIGVAGVGTTLIQSGAVTLNAGKNLVIDGDTFADRVETYNTAGFALNVGGNIQVGAGADTALKTFNGANSAITVGGNFDVRVGGTSQPVFTSTGSTVTFNGSAAQTARLTGSNFNNLVITNASAAGVSFLDVFSAANITDITAASRLTFKAGATYTVSGALTLTGTLGSEIVLLSDSAGTRFTLNVTGGAQTVSYVNVKDSQASTNNITANTSINSGGNDNAEAAPYWIFIYTISGTVYTDEGSTLIGDGAVIRLLVNGASQGTSTTVGGTGTYSISATVGAGDALLVYIDGHASKGSTVTVSNGATLPGLNIYAGHTITRHDNGGSLSNANMGTANGAYVDTDILYSVSAGNLVVTSGYWLYILAGHSYTPGGNVTASGMNNLGIFNGGSGSITVQGALIQSAGTYTATSGTTSISGIFTVSGGTFIHNSGSILMTSTGWRTYNIGATVLNNFTIGIPSAAVTIVGTIAVNGNLNITGGEIISGTLAVAGNVTTTHAGVAGGAMILFNGTGNQILSASGGTGALPGVTINKASGTLTIQDTINIGGTAGWTYTAGTVDAGTSTVSFTDTTATTTVSAGAMTFNNVNIAVGGMTLNVTGTLDVNGNFNITSAGALGGGAITVAGNLSSVDTSVSGTATITLDGSGAQSITATIANADLPNGTLTINKASGTATLASNLILNGAGANVTVTQGMLDLAGYNLTVPATLTANAAGTLQLQGGEAVTAATRTFNAGSTVIYNGGGAYASLAAGNTYSNLTFNNAAGSWTHTGALTANNLTITSGTLISGGQNVTVTGNWSNSGAYTPGANTVTFNGTGQTLSGNTTFNNFTKSVASADTLTFAAGSTTTINGLATINGAAGQLLSLRSSSTPTRWNLNLAGTKSISYVDVRDSDASGSAAAQKPVSPTNSADSGNTISWFSNLAIVKQAWEENGSAPLASPLAAPVGSTLVFLIYVKNTAVGAISDVRINDSLDETGFQYVAGSLIRTNAATPPTDVATDLAIFNATAPGTGTNLSEAVDADMASGQDTGGLADVDKITVGAVAGQANGSLSIAGQATFAVRFKVRVK